MIDAEPPAAALQGDAPAASTAQGRVDRRELAIVAVERTRMPMVITDARHGDQPIVLANQAFLDLTGYAADEVLGRNCRFLQGEGTSRAAIAKIRAALAVGEDCDVELLNYRKDGTAFWNQLHMSLVRDDTGALLYVFASQRDITAYRKAKALEAAERRLLREVDHRAMNALAIVEGIVRLSRSDDPAQYAAAIQGRVRALASAHALLGREGWRNIALEHLLRSQLEGHGARQITIAGPAIDLEPALVQPLALVLHEMVDNAERHGALSSPEGRVAVSWSLEVDGGLALSWIESGGPRPVGERRRGFGMSMAPAIIERQLRGRAELDWRSEGLAARFILPFSHASTAFELSSATEGSADL